MDPPGKPLSLAPVALEMRSLPEGGLVLRSRQELRPYARSLGELLRHWARTAPGRVFLAEREAAEGWRRLTYGGTPAPGARSARALLARGPRPSPPVAIPSPHGIAPPSPPLPGRSARAAPRPRAAPPRPRLRRRRRRLRARPGGGAGLGGAGYGGVGQPARERRGWELRDGRVGRRALAVRDRGRRQPACPLRHDALPR